MPDFEITACHANRAGEASVSLRHHASGAVVMIHHIPFAHTPGAPDEVECDGIRAAAAQMGKAALAFLENVSLQTPIVPDVAPGAAPGAGEPLPPGESDGQQGQNDNQA